MGLFWIRPDVFINLDSTNRAFLALKLPSQGLTFAFYKDTLETVRKHHPDFPRLSHAAWLASQRRGKVSGKVEEPSGEVTQFGRIWIFQANPKIFDIDAALRELPELAWSISAYRDQINPGDRVFIWKSGIAAEDVIARGTVVSRPSIMQTSDEENRFASDPERVARRSGGFGLQSMRCSTF